MARESFLNTPFVDLDPAGVSVSLFTNSSGESSVVLQLGGQVSVHVYDPALLVRLGEVADRGRYLLTEALSAGPKQPMSVSEAAA